VQISLEIFHKEKVYLKAIFTQTTRNP